MSVNKLRGETIVKFGSGVEITMVATMDGMARLSSTINAEALSDLYKRLVMVELTAVNAAIRIFTTSGKDADAKYLKADAAASAAIDGMAFDDAASLSAGFASLLTALIRKPGGKEEPAGEANAPTQ